MTTPDNISKKCCEHCYFIAFGGRARAGRGKCIDRECHCHTQTAPEGAESAKLSLDSPAVSAEADKDIIPEEKCAPNWKEYFSKHPDERRNALDELAAHATPEKKCVHCIKFCSEDCCKFNCDCPCNAAPHSDIEEIVREFDQKCADAMRLGEPKGMDKAFQWLRTTLTSFEAQIRKEERDENYREMNKQMASQYEAGHSAALTEERTRIHIAIEKLKIPPRHVLYEQGYNAALSRAQELINPSNQ